VQMVDDDRHSADRTQRREPKEAACSNEQLWAFVAGLAKLGPRTR
jgi:hypothetical protein